MNRAQGKHLPRHEFEARNQAGEPGGDQVLSTLRADGRRRWLSPRVSPGRLWRWRRAVAFFLIALFTLLPYLSINGKPAVLLDIAARRFTLFGKTFLPTDTLLLALMMLGVFVAVFLVTAVSGRVWCGWGCPQTVYMEFVYRPIERFFSGAPGRTPTAFQRSPAAQALKLAVFFVVSCFLAHTFLAYFVGIDRLAEWVRLSPARHPTPFLVMAVTTGLMMFDFVYFREQTCILACPYGRFQSVMLDRDSRIIAYDTRRGEPRGRRQAAAGDVALPVIGRDAPRTGDCVDCGLCVTTCPTGIDIREGLQMECVNCAQCIDACDAVMTKLKRPTGLIRYGSLTEMNGSPRRTIRARVMVYSAVLAVVTTAFIAVLATKSDTDVTVMRGLGAPFATMPDGTIGNQIRVKIVNRRDTESTYTLTAEGLDGAKVESEAFPLRLGPGEMKLASAVVAAPRGAFSSGFREVDIVVHDGTRVVGRRVHRLQGPAAGGSTSGGNRGPGLDKESPR
ncbi:MAG: cytochrome c oxidase accessory protein CcoG [Phycisphaeraceae bacterium]|nr:cytochrome c oxidase accessory protein CcoG [Phycisphaeraceae bacterium]